LQLAQCQAFDRAADQRLYLLILRLNLTYDTLHALWYALSNQVVLTPHSVQITNASIMINYLPTLFTQHL
ncbi:MAG: hypothetical protein ACRCVN_04420, partial [Spirochaetia bacterium]